MNNRQTSPFFFYFDKRQMIFHWSMACAQGGTWCQLAECVSQSCINGWLFRRQNAFQLVTAWTLSHAINVIKHKMKTKRENEKCSASPMNLSRKRVTRDAKRSVAFDQIRQTDNCFSQIESSAAKELPLGQDENNVCLFFPLSVQISLAPFNYLHNLKSLLR